MSTLIAQPTFPNPQITKNETIQGDLILTNQEVRTIENTHLKVFGKIILQDNSQLIIRQSIIEVETKDDADAVSSGTIEVLNRAILKADTTIFGSVAEGGIDPSQAESLKSGNLIGAGQSQIHLNNCFSQTQSFFGEAKVVMKNSFLIQEPLGLIHVEHQVDILLEDCKIGAILIDLPATIEYDIDSLVPGYFEYWSAREKISDELPYQLVMRRCTLNDNDEGYQGGLELGWNLGLNPVTSRASISNSKLNKIIFGFPPGEPAIIEGLKIQEPINFTLNQIQIINTEVQTQWGIFMEDGPATLTDCEGLFIFMLGGTAPVHVINSEVYEIDPRDYVGTISFEKSIFGVGYEVFDSSHLYMQGSMRAMRPLAFLDASSKITRFHAIKVQFDSDGAPFPPFPLRIMKDSLEIWQGVTDSSGTTEIQITYDLTNYQDDWILESLEPIVSLRKAFGLDASNPITINLRKAENDTMFHPVMHVQRNATIFPDGSRARPYPTIQEAIDNASGEIVLVPAGIYPGNLAPGANQASVALGDHVILQGAGADSTVLEGTIFSEDVDDAALIGFEVKEGFQFINVDMTIRNCLVTSHSDHALIGANSNLNIFNNTFVSNAGDAIFLIDSSVADIRNNIFASNDGFGLEALAGTTVQADYNNVWSNGDNYVHAELIGEHDISVDPLFVDGDNGDYRLQSGSPCIDAGDPRDLFNDIDGTQNDLGALGGPLGGVTTSIQDVANDYLTGLELKIIPNPLRSQTQISYRTPVQGKLNLAIYDVGARLVQVLVDERVIAGNHDLTWYTDYLPRNIYVIMLQTEVGTLIKKIVVL